MRYFLLLIALTLPRIGLAAVQSETILFLQPDGKNYLLQRSIHSNSLTHRFHVDKSTQLEDIRHISPARYEWDNQSDSELNSLSFESGGFTVIYPGKFGNELKRNKDGSFTYKSWDGVRDKNNRYGYWYAPGNFGQFSYSWILPKNAELLRYRSNRIGTWTKRENAVSFYAERANNLTFEISFRIKKVKTAKSPAPKVKTVTVVKTVYVEAKAKECPKLEPTPVIKAVAIECPKVEAPPAIKQPVILFNEEPDETEIDLPLEVKPQPAIEPDTIIKDQDGDSVLDADDLCPDTLKGAKTDRAGCSLDTDKDGVPNGIDICMATAEETRVDGLGCSTEQLAK